MTISQGGLCSIRECKPYSTEGVQPLVPEEEE
jgi:hypothetical protein